MKVFDFDKMAPLPCSVLTIGNFDGVHRAHQQLLAQAGLFASSDAAPVTVLTFEPHPMSVLAPERAPARLSRPEQKLQLLEAAGAEIVVVARACPALFALEAETFVREVIVGKFAPTHVVEGPNFGFGKGRRGTPDLLRDMGREAGFEVHILDPMQLEIDGEVLMVSSSLVRRLLGEGKVRRAAMCLGRNYTLSGEVVRGAGRGRTIGFPTINLDYRADVDRDQGPDAGTSEGCLVPCEGVYSGSTRIEGRQFPCAVSIGKTPTFGGDVLQVEAHVLDFSGDLYGSRLTIDFLRYLRPQKKFESADALVAQLHRDVAEVRAAQDPPAGMAGGRS